MVFWQNYIFGFVSGCVVSLLLLVYWIHYAILPKIENLHHHKDDPADWWKQGYDNEDEDGEYEYK